MSPMRGHRAGQEVFPPGPPVDEGNRKGGLVERLIPSLQKVWKLLFAQGAAAEKRLSKRKTPKYNPTLAGKSSRSLPPQGQKGVSTHPKAQKVIAWRF